MLSEIAPEEFALTLDELAADVLAEAEWAEPPINALDVAQRLGLEVAYDRRQVGRGRFVRLRDFGAQQPRDSIFLRPEPRPERVQWAVAHEIGEKFACHVFDRLGVSPYEAPRGIRETVANHLAGRLLLPGDWFWHDAVACGWDLVQLKRRYATASHELIARRMLDFAPWIHITVFDNGRQTFRQSNRFRRKPELLPGEVECRELVVSQAAAQTVEAEGYRVQGWPIYESDWKREILRTERNEGWDAAA